VDQDPICIGLEVHTAAFRLLIESMVGFVVIVGVVLIGC
jgi:hypothetical protein